MSLDHGKVTINLPSKDPAERKSISFTVIGGTDKFVNHYGLQKSSTTNSTNMDLNITIEGNYENQKEYYVSNDTKLKESVENQDSSDIKKFYQ
jgi:hypothetical protein